MSEFTDFLIEHMTGFGQVRIRPMFGGSGVYRDGVMFALVADGVLYLKADDLNRADFDAEGLEAFSYARRGGRTTVMSYRRAPERCLEGGEQMAAWCRRAYDAALRARGPKRKSRASQGC